MVKHHSSQSTSDLRHGESMRMRHGAPSIVEALPPLSISTSPQHSSNSAVDRPGNSSRTASCSPSRIASPPMLRSPSCTSPPRHYEETCCPPDVSPIQHLFDNNKKWREKKHRHDATFFERLAEGQHPRYLWIGCSDSRVPAEEITGLRPGEMFVHRNVANMVVSNDVSCLSAVQFAVEQLRVRDIIVCGHYGCGGVRAAMANQSLGLLDNWLRNIRDVCRMHQTELVAIENEQVRFRRIVELNIREQCLNMFKINMVQRNQQKYGFPRIHGLVYDMQAGALKPLDIDYAGYVRALSGIYRLHTFATDDFPPSVQQMRRNMIQSLAEGHEEDANGAISVRYITRVLKTESDLFTPQDVDDGIEFARDKGFRTRSSSGFGSDLHDAAFVQIEHLVEFFAPLADMLSTDGNSSSDNGTGPGASIGHFGGHGVHGSESRRV